MAVTTPALAQEIARCWAQTVASEAAVQRLWVQATNDYAELWLLTAPSDFAAERRLYDAAAHVQVRFPDAAIRFHVLNPNNYESAEPADWVPDTAVEVSLRSV